MLNEKLRMFYPDYSTAILIEDEVDEYLSMLNEKLRMFYPDYSTAILIEDEVDEYLRDIDHD
jgi:hypothetical protein